MAYGFQASDFLKADTIDYGPSKEDYEPFFTSLNGKWGWDTVYTASKEEVEEASLTNTVLTVIATTIMMAPFALLANKILF